MIWQTKKWQKMLKDSNQVEKTISLDFNWKEIFIEKRKISLWETALFILWFNVSLFDKELEKKLIEICKLEKSLFLQIETFSYEENINLNSTNFKKWYFKNFITPYTAIINLKKSEDEILANMKPKWRYNIKLATKKWVIVKSVEKTDENIQIFTDLITQTAKRDNFMTNPDFKYYKSFLENLSFSKIIFAYFEWKVISAWIFTYEKDVAIYYYWASTSDKKYRNLMAPYLVQWEAIKIAKEKNFKIYDFLWITTPWTENDSLSWVTNFKLKLTKNTKNVSEDYIFINKKIKYRFMIFLRKIQKKYF